MWIFGRKANQSPASPVVPPELQQYYAQPSLGSHVRRIGLFVLPVLAAAALIAALITGGVLLKHRYDSSHQQVATTGTSSTSQGEISRGQQHSMPPSQSPQQSASPVVSPTPTTGTVQTPDTNDHITTPATIPSTGSDVTVFLFAGITSTVAMLAAYVFQLHALRR